MPVGINDGGEKMDEIKNGLSGDKDTEKKKADRIFNQQITKAQESRCSIKSQQLGV